MEENLRAALEAIGDGVLMMDADGHAVFANGPWRKMWEIPDDWNIETIDENIDEVTENLLDTDGTYNLMERSDGKLIERFSTPLLLHGETNGHVWVFRDVTDRIQADSALREAHRALDRLMSGHRVAWKAVSAILRRVVVAQEALAAYFDTPPAYAWEIKNAIRLVNQMAKVEQVRRGRTDLSEREDEVAAYLREIGESAGTRIETTIKTGSWLQGDPDIFVAGILSALIGFVLAADPRPEQASVVLERAADGDPLTVTVMPPIAERHLKQLTVRDAARPGGLHAALLRALGSVADAELTVSAATEQGTTMKVTGA